MLKKILMMFLLIVTCVAMMYAQSFEEEDKTKTYLSLIKPKTDIRKGIDKGALLLYGQWVKPPYQIQVKEERLLINGVQVSPPIVPPWVKQEELEITEDVKDLVALTTKVRAKHKQLKNYDSIDKVHEKITAFVNREKIVTSSNWASDDHLEIVLTDGFEFSIVFKPPTIIAKNHQRDILLKRKQSITKKLRNGSLIVIGYGVKLNIPKDYLPKRMNEIKKASKAKNKKKLQKLLVDDELVKELLFISK